MAERMQSTLAVFVFLVDDQDRVYLQRRYQTGYHDGYYEPPAGKIDEGELVSHAAPREALEEAGVSVDYNNLELFHTYMNITNNNPWFGMMFRSRVWKGEPSIQEPNKCDDAGWFSLDNLPKVTTQVRDALGRIMTGPTIEISEYDNLVAD